MAQSTGGNTASPQVLLFPQDLPQWDKMKAALQQLTQPCTDLDTALGCLCQLWAAKKSSRKTTVPLANTPFRRLEPFFQRYSEPDEASHFLQTTLPAIAHLVLEGENLLADQSKRLKYSLQQVSTHVVLSRKLVASIVATAFLSLFPGCVDDTEEERMESMPDINFSGLLTLMGSSERAKIKCFLNYFDRISEMNFEVPGEMTFRRIVVPKEDLLTSDALLECTKPLCPFLVPDEGLIEDAGGRVLQVDFANAYLGGGVLFSGCVQEEIRFCICPELVASMLFMESMAANEAVILSGFEQFSKYSGYGFEFRYDGSYADTSEKDDKGNFLTSLSAIDAIPYRRYDNCSQFEPVNYLRDINKAYVGFLQPYVEDRSLPDPPNDPKDDSWFFSLPPEKVRAVATGNWGCGAFGGHTQFKALLQWIAASAADCPAVIYYKFDDELVEHLSKVAEAVLRAKWTVSDLFKCVVEMCDQLLAEAEEMGNCDTEPFAFLMNRFECEEDEYNSDTPGLV